MEETDDKKTEEDSENNTKINQAETDDSLSLSITPPIPEDNKKDNENSDASISEHLTSNSTSVENDRSYQEIEISNRPSNILFDLPSSDEEKHLEQHISDEHRLRSLEASFYSDNSIISLNCLDRIYNRDMEVNDNVRSILEEILNNEQFDPDVEGLASLTNSKEESLDIFANVVLDDKSLTNFRNSDSSLNENNLFGSNFGLPLLRNQGDVDKRLKDFEEMLAIKDTTIAALTSELDSCRESSNTNSGSIVSTTEYKQLQEECHSKLMEYNTAIVYKNDLIQQLSESLDQSVSERKELLKQVNYFKDEIVQLQTQLQETTKMVNEHKCSSDNEEFVNVPGDKENVEEIEKDVSEEKTEKSEPLINLDLEYSNLEENLNLPQKNLLNDLKIKINEFVKQNIMKNRNLYEEEIIKLKERIVLEKEDYETEIARLRDLLANIKCGSSEIMELKNELEAKHSREVEELRMYFEKKCVDLEKNYSEEVFSQQSRKMSGSTCSEAELNSDILFSHSPGPDGDIRYELQPNITKKDLTNLKNELNSILSKMNRYNLDNITEDDFSALKSEIGKCNLNNLLKYDLAIIKADLQNKYYAELEVLRESNENKVDVLNVEHENRLKSLESKYLEEMENLRFQLDELTRQNVSSAVQEVASFGEFEINEVIQSYERRLQEQVTLAKVDIISALESQIQRLVANEADDETWPSELLQLRERFTDRYENEIRQLKNEHQKETERLKEEHMKVLNGALERARRRSLKDSDSLSKGDLEILKQRDSFKKQVFSLRNLLGELLKYFTQCEDELNNTLVDELLKQGFDKNMSQIEEELNLNDSSPTNSSKTGESLANVTRVHLTPNFSDLINLVESNLEEDCESRDISLELKNELGVCLEKLKQEANAILALTTNMPNQSSPAANKSPKSNSLDEKLSSLTRQLISEVQVKEKLMGELNEAMTYIETLEKEKDELETNLDQVIAKGNMLEQDLLQARNKLAELIENGHKETVSEGYGEEGHAGMHNMGDTMTILAELQERARNMLVQSRASANPTLLHLIEELCRVGERIKEESHRERLDLVQQIAVADRKCRTTQKFLEEQAVERELERDEAQKKIDQLHEQLRERDRDRANNVRFSDEVEQLEQQLQEMTRLHAEEAKKFKGIETERNEAIDKIKVLREIIRELELQNEAKSKEVDSCLHAIQKLECIIDQQDRSINDLKQNHSLKDISDIHELRRHIDSLETELQQSRLTTELAGGEDVFKQINVQLFEFEISLDKTTKELELLHSTETNCSSPSEDISARDVIRPASPVTMNECEVPLQQLARLKEKLVRHSRAEDAAIKRIRDLEMQVFGLKNELEESNGEKEYIKKQVQEQLVLISDLQIRLDEQRIRADHIEKQTNTSLELKIYDLQNEIISLREKLQSRDKAISHHTALLDEAQHRLKTMEEEMSSTKEDEILVMMQREIEMLRSENSDLKTKIKTESQLVPNLVGNIISDKNIDIEKLREKLQEAEKLLESYTSLNLDRHELQTLSNLKSHGTSLEEVLSILELSHNEQVRKSRSQNDIEDVKLLYRRNSNETGMMDNTSVPEISSIEKIGPSNFCYDIHLPYTKTNSTENQKSIEKHVHFEDLECEKLKDEISTLRSKLESREKAVEEYKEQLKLLKNVEEKVEKLQLTLEETENALVKANETFGKEQQELREREKNFGVDLAEKKLQLSEKEKQIEILLQDSTRKDEICLKLTREKQELENALCTMKQDNFNSLDRVIKEKNIEIDSLQLSLQSNNSEKLERLERQLADKNMETFSLQTEKEHLQSKLDKLTASWKNIQMELKKSNEENEKLKKELQNNTAQVEEYKEQLKLLKNLEGKVEKLQLTLEETENALVKANETFGKEQQELREREKNLEVDLAEKKFQLSEKEKQIEILLQDSTRKDEMCMKLTREKQEIESALCTIKQDNFNSLDRVIKKKDSETTDSLQLSLQSNNSEKLGSLERQLADKNMETFSLQTEKEYLQRKLDKLTASWKNLQAKFKKTNEENAKLKKGLQNNATQMEFSLQTEQEYSQMKMDNLIASSKNLQAKLKETDEENAKLKKELQNNAAQMETVMTEMNSLKEKVAKKRRSMKELEDVIQKQERSIVELEKEVKKQKEIVADRECEIEIANEDARRYQNDLEELENKIKQLEAKDTRAGGDNLMEDIKEKNIKIDELCKEKLHLQELLNEKDKIINQISEDSHKLHVNLVTIQTKLKETGNIVDLGNKLKEEQKRTADLLEEVHDLKTQLMQHEMTKKDAAMSNSVDEITDQLKRELDYSAQIDSNIISAVSDQSLSSISETQDVEIYKHALVKEKSTRKQLAQMQEQLKNEIILLEKKSATLQSLNNELQISLEKESLVLQQTQAQDAKLIEQMRIQLDTVLDSEEAFRNMLAEEKTARKQLEEELEVFRKKTTNSSSTFKTDSTEYVTLPSKEAIMVKKLRQDVDELLEENDKLMTEIKQLKHAKSELETDHKYTKEMLNLEIQNRKSLEDKVQELMTNERELQEVLLQKKMELEAKLQEMEHISIILGKLEEEKAHLSKQKQELVQRLKLQTSNEAQTASTSVPDALLNKIKELNDALLDNKKLVDIIQKISGEKMNLESQIADLKERKAANAPFGDLVARSDYLFAKTLKLESVKKALIWQKRYLLDYLHAHQRHCMVEALPDDNQYRVNLPRKQRFRSVVYVIISVLRMKYLVRRWHTGVRVAEKVNSRHYKHLLTKYSAQTKFHVGQPVSSQLFSNTVGNPFNKQFTKSVFNFNRDESQENQSGFFDDGRISPASSRQSAPWSGNTPPSKEGVCKNRIRIGSHVVNKEDITPLKAPQLLSQFVERFDQIQDKLGVILDTNTT